MSQVKRYQRPQTVQQACEAMLANPNAKLVAGGQSLLPTFRLGLALFDEIIDLQGLSDASLNYIVRHLQHHTDRNIQHSTDMNLNRINEQQLDTLTIGAMTTHAQVAASAEVQAFSPMLTKLAGGIGDAQVRTMGTLGGSIANPVPAACWPAGRLACGGFVSVSSSTQTRKIDIDDFFTGMFSTDLNADEMITSVTFLKPLSATYLKFEQPASRFALVGVAVAHHANHVKVAITGLGHGVMRWHEAEVALHQRFEADALKTINLDPDLACGDLHASAPYRTHIAKVLCQRAVNQHLSR
jgi:carbon-monoxide dehydrogenase medium subunit